MCCSGWMVAGFAVCPADNLQSAPPRKLRGLLALLGLNPPCTMTCMSLQLCGELHQSCRARCCHILSYHTPENFEVVTESAGGSAHIETWALMAAAGAGQDAHLELQAGVLSLCQHTSRQALHPGMSPLLRSHDSLHQPSWLRCVPSATPWVRPDEHQQVTLQHHHASPRHCRARPAPCR